MVAVPACDILVSHCWAPTLPRPPPTSNLCFDLYIPYGCFLRHPPNTHKMMLVVCDPTTLLIISSPASCHLIPTINDYANDNSHSSEAEYMSVPMLRASHILSSNSYNSSMRVLRFPLLPVPIY